MAFLVNWVLVADPVILGLNVQLVKPRNIYKYLDGKWNSNTLRLHYLGWIIQHLHLKWLASLKSFKRFTKSSFHNCSNFISFGMFFDDDWFVFLSIEVVNMFQNFFYSISLVCLQILPLIVFISNKQLSNNLLRFWLILECLWFLNKTV